MFNFEEATLAVLSAYFPIPHNNQKTCEGHPEKFLMMKILRHSQALKEKLGVSPIESYISSFSQKN